MTTLRAIFTIVGVAAVAAVLIPAQYFAMALRSERWTARLPWWFHLAATRLIGLKIIQHGAPTPNRPLLILANHVSWLDITVIGALMPISFISKAEVASWPVIGRFAKLQRTIFVERERRAATGKVAGEIAKRLRSGHAMVLFPEGTSGNGTHVLPFRTALIGAARQAIASADETVWIQPLALAYTRLHGLPLGRFRKPHVAWYGDMQMAKHFWSVLKHGEIDVDVIWGEPVIFDASTDRKEVARRAERVVRYAVADAIAGRYVEDEARAA
jgi:1-acyl-sn-glycerol-3-phosphate acyltransferase